MEIDGGRSSVSYFLLLREADVCYFDVDVLLSFKDLERQPGALRNG